MARSEFPVRDYDLATTLNCGQAFRWRQVGDAWEGVIHGRWVRLRQTHSSDPSHESYLEATTALPGDDWRWLTDYLRLDEDLDAQLATFPDDAPMHAAAAHCRGLRLLRQDPWECLASFILSSTKQIVQIRQCVELLCQRYGHPLPVGQGENCPSQSSRIEPPNRTERRSPDRPVPDLVPQLADREIGAPAHGEEQAWFTFPSAEEISATSETELRECRIGFRAKYLLDAARRVRSGELNLNALAKLPLAEARTALMNVHGVGCKIADCVLLFSLGFDAAFPIDVWVERALRQLYFPKRRVKRARIEQFAATHFGPHAGLAQQYLFHYLRTRQ